MKYIKLHLYTRHKPPLTDKNTDEVVKLHLKRTIAAIVSACMLTITASAQSTYTVKSGDTLWKIASKHRVGLSELIAANPQIKNISLIYPGQKIKIPAQPSTTAFEDEVIRLVNNERAKRGLMKLTKNWELSRVARYKSQDMANKHYFSHTSPTYGSPFTMMQNFGIRFSAAGENIAMGQRTPQEVMNAWMNSAGHKANILSPAYNQIGVGMAKNSAGVVFWAQEFIKAS